MSEPAIRALCCTVRDSKDEGTRNNGKMSRNGEFR